MIELGAFIGAMNQGADTNTSDKTSTNEHVEAHGSSLQGGTEEEYYNCNEIAPPEIRGTLLVLQELSIVTAIVIAFYITYATRKAPAEQAKYRESRVARSQRYTAVPP
jgi:hypothetical protein